MGLFGKLKDNFSHGGVKVHLQAPSSVPGNQVIPVRVDVTAGDTPQTVNSVRVEIKVETREQGVEVGARDGYTSQQTTAQTIAQVESREQFMLAPNETKSIDLQLYLNGTAAMGGNPAGQLGAMGGRLGGALQTMASIAGNFENVSRLYTVHAHADVAGISMDPSDKQPIQILPPATQAPVDQSVASVE